MTTQARTRKIDVDTHFYPPVDYKALREYLPQGLVAQAQDMLVRGAMRAAEPEWVAAETSGAAPPVRYQADPHGDPSPWPRPGTRQVLTCRCSSQTPCSPTSMAFPRPAVTCPSRFGLPSASSIMTRWRMPSGRYPDRFIGPVNIPFDDLEASVLETRRAVQELGLRAVLVPG